ncbi:hypothetical protein CEUSTIGMA_g4882.t1 [Chlamydomonas eustigma]|uniref:Uncharacterized protein n=1 Tax=Chlamydomonas eustigma TaxID=1157962 RepID=A0A250X2Y6_9CHLO|nr:hypothetical protein CEUSTIGMA_g4882.t1 [Chlamydomonas eustigma]|eukprot:GAX77437.1 hypothetical protein CEUSTIGMA_g4882.t1 [Chlamydomonas eustigma]
MKTALRLHSGKATCACPVSRRFVRANAGEGVQDLLARDRRESKVASDLETNVFLPGTSSSGPKESENNSKETKQEVLKSKKQRQAEMAKAAKESDPNRPTNCKQAIDQGLALFNKQLYQEAVDMFNLALELPGQGAYRLAGSVREYSCPSDAEENAALYNMACAYCKMGRKSSALTCIEAILENDFKDINALKTDPDLEPVRGSELDSLIFKFNNPLSKMQSLFGSSQKQKSLKSDTNKPWLMW